MKSIIKKNLLKYIGKIYQSLLYHSYQDKDKIKLKFLMKLNHRFKINHNKYILFNIVKHFEIDDQLELIPLVFKFHPERKYSQSEQEDIIAQVSYSIELDRLDNHEMLWDRMKNGCINSKKIFLMLYQNGFYPMYYYALDQNIVPNSKSFNGHLIQMSRLLIEKYGVNSDIYLLNSGNWMNKSVKKELIPYFL